MDVEQGQLLGVRETARRLGVHENTVRNWSRQGLLPDARVPGSRFHRFRAADVERLLARRGSAAPTLQSERRAVNPELVSANQLKQWPATRSRDAQENLPELVRRLLAETPGITDISIRSGDGVALSGWDGVAESTGTAFLPAGHLGLEFGVDQNPKTKADHDYENRVGDTASSLVFVFVTPRRWAGGPAWAEKRRAEGNFADVRVVDADGLEGWLRATPGAHHWISEHLGLRPRDAMTLDAWWERFSRRTDPVLPRDLFVAGRSAQASTLLERLADRPQLTVVQSESTEDVLAFVQSSRNAPTHDRGPTNPAAIMASTVEVWDRILEQPGNAVLIPQFDGADVGAALDKGHQVINVIDRNTVSRRAIDIALPRLDRTAAANAFQAAGMEFGQADRLAALGRRSLPALIRHLSRNPSFNRPSWASSPDAELLAPLVLIGSWTTTDEDTAAVGALTGRPWDAIERTVRRVAASTDPVLRKIGDNWSFTSPEEAFLCLQDSLTTESIEWWSKEMQLVLLEPDPLFELAPNERAGARLRGVRRPYSDALRRGLGQGLALMGSMGATTTLDNGITLAGMAELVVGQLLDQANQDSSGRAWRQLSDILPLLAEAAPDNFLVAVNDDLATPTPVLLQLFHDDGDALLGPSPRHPHLLWALETVCWAEPYLLQGVRALAQLATIDPGGKSGNRPSASMAAILCGWVRNTSAPLAVRLDALDAVLAVSAAAGWRLIFALWPTDHGWVSPPAAPHFRDNWRPSASSVSMADWATFTRALVDRALANAGSDPARLVDLVDGLTKVSPADRDRIIDFLEAQAARSLDDNGRLRLWEAMHALLARHERFPTAAWAMPADARTSLVRVVSALEPKDDPQRFTYLFDWRPDLPGVDSRNYQRYETELQQVRRQAVRTVLDGGAAFAQFAQMAQRVKAPSQLGIALAEQEDVTIEQLAPWLDADNPALTEVALNWARSRMVRSGAAWLADTLRHPGLAGPARQAIVGAVVAGSDFWQALHDSPVASDEVDYWSTAPIEIVPLPDTVTAVAQLIAHGRAWSALSVAAHALGQAGQEGAEAASPPLDQRSLIDLINKAVAQPPRDGEISQMTGYYVGQILDHLTVNDAPISVIARFEFAMFRLLEHDREPAALNRVLATEPEEFVSLVKLAYRAKDEPRRESTESEQNLATQAWWVLNGWTGFPGRDEDGNLNEGVMTAWVRDARLDLSDANRADIGDELIGETFAYSPNGADGVWPAEPVRRLIEAIGSTELENGVLIGRRNSRGVTSRGVYDGGEQERALALQYREGAAAVRTEWPRTARILRNLAGSYEQDAHSQDVRAELDADRV